MTKQRELILNILKQSDRHLTADEIFFLADHEKIRSSYKIKKDFDALDYIITDFEIPAEVREKHRGTKFVLA